MRMFAGLFVAFFVMVSLPSGAASAPDGTVCFRCHDRSAFSGPVVHRPVARGRCVRCHSPHVARNQGLLRQDVADLCLGCHDMDKEKEGAVVVHKPVRDGDCLACHDPHVSKVRGLVREDRRGQACFRCHEAELGRKYKRPHRPYAEGRCTACHAPHASGRFLLLRAVGADLCRKCHPDRAVKAAHTGFPVRAKGACLTCHNPHGSDRKGLVRKVMHPPYEEDCGNCHDGDAPVTTDTCLECHQDDLEKDLYSSHNHLVDPVNSCVKCHSPHASDREDLLRGRQERVCRPCHLDTFARKEGALHPHPLDKATCKDCHAVHGSNQIALLKTDGVAVCTSCHETQGKFTHPVGDKVHDPRTGQPVTCVSCHYPHGTDFEYNLKLSGAKDLCVQCHRSY